MITWSLLLFVIIGPPAEPAGPISPTKSKKEVNRMKKTLSLLLAAAMCVSLLAGCTSNDPNSPSGAPSSAPSQGADPTQQGGDATTPPSEGDTTLRTTAIMTSEHFTPLKNGNGDKHVFHALFDCLFMFDNDGNAIPMLAESYTEDGLTVDIKLRKDATFSDGTPVHASDVVFSYATTLEDPVLMYNMTMCFTNCEAVDDTTVRFTLTNGYCKWENLLAELLYILKEDGYDKNDDYTDHAPVGSGPYTLESIGADASVTLKARDDYWRLTPTFKTVIVNAAMDDATEMVALQTGELDLAPMLGLTSYKQAQGIDSLTTVSFNGWQTMGLMSFAGDAAFRQAIAYAINRQTILDICNDGNGEPSTNAFAPKVMGDYTGKVEYPGYDVDKAKELLNQSSADLTKTYTISVFDDDSAAVAQCIQGDLAAIGLNVQISKMDINAWFDALMAGNLEFGITAMATDIVVAEDMMSMFDPDAGYPFPLSDELLQLVKNAPYIADNAERETEMLKLLNQINAEGLWVPLFDNPMYMAYSNRLGNINDCGCATAVFYFSDMTLK